MLRPLAAGFAAATIPSMYVLGRRLFDPRVGAAAVLVATNAFLLQWGQQLRTHVEPLTPGPSDPPAGERLWVFDRVTQGGTGGSATISGFAPWRDRLYELVDERLFGGVVVRLYQRRAG